MFQWALFLLFVHAKAKLFTMEDEKGREEESSEKGDQGRKSAEVRRIFFNFPSNETFRLNSIRYLALEQKCEGILFC